MKQKLLEILTEHPQSRDVLRRKLGCSDRMLRSMVTELRRDGYPVCSSSHRNGYWLGTQADRKALAREYRHRGARMFEIANKLESGATKSNQVRWDL